MTLISKVFKQAFIFIFCFFILGCANSSKTPQNSRFELGVLDVKTAPLSQAEIQKIERIFDWAQRYDFEDFPTTIYGLYLADSLNLHTDGGISELVAEFGELVHLRRLDLSFANLDELPNTLCQLRGLKELNLKNAKIKTLPKCLITLPNLKIIKSTN